MSEVELHWALYYVLIMCTEHYICLHLALLNIYSEKCKKDFFATIYNV